MINEDMYKKLEAMVNDHELRIQILEGRKSTGSKKSTAPSAIKEDTNSDIVMAIVNKIADCEESEAIEKKILDSRDQKLKTLLCYYVSYKYFSNRWLSSGDIEKITAQLGTKIDRRNVPKVLRLLRSYLESDMARKVGARISYRLNRRGAQHFEGVLNAEEKTT